MGRALPDGAIQAYNDGIRLCLVLGDNGTRELIDADLKAEESHIDWLEAQLEQIGQTGLQTICWRKRTEKRAARKLRRGQGRACSLAA